MVWKEWIGKKIYVEYDDNDGKTRVYSGVVKEVFEFNAKYSMIIILDKFEKYVGFLTNKIKFIKEEEDFSKKEINEKDGEKEVKNEKRRTK